MPYYGDDILSKVACDPVALFDQYQYPVHYEAKPDYQAERDEAREVARRFWGTMKLYIRGQTCFSVSQNEERIARRLAESPWLEEQT
jgi:hypothetical protein